MAFLPGGSLVSVPVSFFVECVYLFLCRFSPFGSFSCCHLVKVLPGYWLVYLWWPCKMGEVRRWYAFIESQWAFGACFWSILWQRSLTAPQPEHLYLCPLVLVYYSLFVCHPPFWFISVSSWGGSGAASSRSGPTYWFSVPLLSAFFCSSIWITCLLLNSPVLCPSLYILCCQEHSQAN